MGVISTKGSEDMNYLDMIPSNTEREYLKNKGVALSDKMTATLIYHAVTDYHERMARLEAYAGETTDKALSEQIKARIQHENIKYERFVSNDGQYILLELGGIDHPGWLKSPDPNTERVCSRDGRSKNSTTYRKTICQYYLFDRLS